jgi:myo-inositol-1(or 4)-monophosphatase
MTNDIVKFLSVAWDAANSAGEIVRARWHQPKTIDYKGAIDLVTSVDRETERSIVELIQKNFPSHSSLAEEQTDLRGDDNEYRWIIDPLDGTTNFAHGYPQVSISVGLEQSGRLILGLVYDPLRRECFRAVKGQGATLNGSPIQISTVKELDKALLATGFAYDHREKQISI